MSTPKLPVQSTVRQAYAATREQLHVLAQIAQRWGLAAGIGLALSAWLASTLPRDRIPVAERAATFTALPVLILALGAYVIIVRWHRLLVQNLSVEQTAREAFGGGLLYLARATYLTVIGLSVAVAGSLLPITLTRNLLDGDARRIFAVSITALAVMAALALLARLSLILPAGAVGDYSITLWRSWSLTRGNTLRMLAGSALASGPAILTDFAINASTRAAETVARDVTAIGILTIVSFILAIVAGVIQAGFLSYAYLFFTTDRSPGAIDQPPVTQSG